jgi:hypothetical protein
MLMGSNGFVSWTGFALFILTVIVAMLVVFAPLLAPSGFPGSEAVVWVMGILALLSAVLGFITFRTPQGKIAAIGGVVFLLAVLFIIPTSSTISG